MARSWRYLAVFPVLLFVMMLAAAPAQADMAAPEEIQQYKAQKEEAQQNELREKAVPSIRPDDGNRIEPQPPTRRATPECVRGGCSGELCVNSEDGGMASACIWKPEFECYKAATCERQYNGKCGWSPSATLQNCLREKRRGG